MLGIKNKFGKKTVAITGIAAMSMMAFTPVYAAEMPEKQDVKIDKEKEVNKAELVAKNIKFELGKIYIKDEKGKLVKLPDAEARAVNPLHDLNVHRQGLILDAISTGDWSTYNAFEALQAPYHFDLNENGEVVHNKNYYANLVTSSYDAMVRAQMDGDVEKKAIWEKSLKERIEQFNKAPGMSVYIPRINSTDKLAEEYGIQAPDKDYFDSVYNNYDVRTKGYADSRPWYENPHYAENPELIIKVVESLSEYTNMSQTELNVIISEYEKLIEKDAEETKKKSEDNKDFEDDKKSKDNK